MTSTGAPKAAGKKVTSDAILVPNPVGLHARPASVLSNIAAQYDSEISLKRGEDQANAKSVIAIMGMEVRYGDKVRVVAYGADAEAAVADLAAQITVGLGEEGVVAIAEAGAEPAAPAPAPAPVAPAPRRRSDDPNVLLGVAASPGLGVGTVVQVRHEDFEVKEDSARSAPRAPPAQRRHRPVPGAARGPGGPAGERGRRRQGGHLRRSPGDPA